MSDCWQEPQSCSRLNTFCLWRCGRRAIASTHYTGDMSVSSGVKKCRVQKPLLNWLRSWRSYTRWRRYFSEAPKSAKADSQWSRTKRKNYRVCVTIRKSIDSEWCVCVRVRVLCGMILGLCIGRCIGVFAAKNGMHKI